LVKDGYIDFDSDINPKKDQYEEMNAYAKSKLCNILFTNGLNEKWGSKVKTYAVSQGATVQRTSNKVVPQCLLNCM